MVVRWIKKNIRKIYTTGTAARPPGSGRKRTVQAVDNIIDVNARNLRNFEKKNDKAKKPSVMQDLVFRTKASGIEELW